MSENVVEIEGLSRQFGKFQALDHISLQVQPGLVYGLVGANGAGKTTLMKHLLGLLQAQQGSVRVFDLDPAKHPVEMLCRIGYLSEERDLPEWMRIDELLHYTAAFYPKWDSAYARELLNTFRLDPSKKIKQLSKGMRAQAGIVAAVAQHPDLLLLDEPSTGLDAVVRKDILNAIIRTVADNGRTAIFSSHLLDEVQLMSDYVFMIDQGRLVLQGSLDDVLAQHQVLSLRLPEGRQLPSFDGLLSSTRHGNLWEVVYDSAAAADRNELTRVVHAMDGEVTFARHASLQEIFVARVGRQTADNREVLEVAQ